MPKFDTIGHSKAHEAQIDIHNPNFDPDPKYAKDRTNPATVKATLNLNESIVLRWHFKGQIGDAEKMAAIRFRQTWETVAGVRNGAMDYTRERVDGQGDSEPVVDAQMQARKDLTEIAKLLGSSAYDTVTKLCAQCLQMQQVENHHRRQAKVKNICIASLGHMAVFYGYKTSPMRSYHAA